MKKIINHKNLYHKNKHKMIINDRPVESETEKSTEEYLDKYILLHCAKLELSLIDVSTVNNYLEISRIVQ